MRSVFIGTGEIGIPTLRALLQSPKHEVAGIITQPDKPVGRSQILTPPPIKAAAAGSIVEVFQPKRIKAEESLTWLRERSPDVIVVMAYGQILPRSVLELPRLACVNVHASLLPRHRGASCISAAIAAGDRETGITIMYMDEGLDTGDILLQQSVRIAQDETGASLQVKLAQMAPALLLSALDQLQGGTAPRRPQRNDLVTYAPKLGREDGRIDWSEPADLIERKIRAHDPWPGAFTMIQKPDGTPVKLKIFRATVSPREGGLRMKDLTLEDVQLEGKKRMTGTELLRGNSWVATAITVN